MSLINEALKKAQKERGGEVPPLTAMPTVGGESAQRISRRGKTSGLPTGWLIGGGLLALGLVGGAIFLLQSPSAPPSPAVAVTPPPQPPERTGLPAPASPVATAPTAPLSVPGVTKSVPSLPASTPLASPPVRSPEIVLPAPVAKIESPPPALFVSAPVTPATAAVAPVFVPSPAVPALVLPAAEPARPGKLEPRAINFIESLRVAGIRASATDSKVLMNDRVYRLGTIVEHEMGLKLTGITSNSLTFEDEQGGTYTRTF